MRLPLVPRRLSLPCELRTQRRLRLGGRLQLGGAARTLGTHMRRLLRRRLQRRLQIERSRVSPLYLAYISPIFPLYFPHDSHISPLYLAYISPISRLQLRLQIERTGALLRQLGLDGRHAARLALSRPLRGGEMRRRLLRPPSMQALHLLPQIGGGLARLLFRSVLRLHPRLNRG